jgi:hypothetical protein
MLVISDPPNGAASTPVTSWSARQSNIHFGADAAWPRATAKAGAGEPTIVDVAADGAGNENATRVGLQRAFWSAGPGVADVAAEVARTGGAPVDGLIPSARPDH